MVSKRLLYVAAIFANLSCAAQNSLAPSASLAERQGNVAKEETIRYGGRCHQSAGTSYALEDGRACRIVRVTFDFVSNACNETRSCAY